jgi:hypothetical protein
MVMSDTSICSNCGASMPSAAKFCTTCGTAVAIDAGRDATHVDGPRPDSPTKVLPPVEATSSAPAWQPPTASDGPATSAPSQPWAPADADTPVAPAPSATTWNQPPAAPAGAAVGPPPAWQQPPAAPAYGQAPAGPSAWGAPPGQTPAWGRGPAPTAASVTKTISPLGGLVALIGGILTLVGIFTAWVGPKGGKALTGWDLTKNGYLLKSADPYLLLALAIGALVIGGLRFTGSVPPIARAAAIIVGLVIIGVMVRDWLTIVDVVKKLSSDVKVEQKFGYFLAIAGGVVTAASAAMPSTEKTP